MQVDVVDWSSRKAFCSPQMSMATASTTSLSTAVVSPMNLNILSYHIPLQSFKENITESKCIPKETESDQVHKVHFPDDDNLVLVIEFDDDLESKESRTCYWEIFARDRCRFKDRIEQASCVLNPILESAHRDRVYSKLYSSEVADTSLIPSSSEQNVPNGSSESCGSSSTGKKSRRKRRKCRSHRK